MAPARTPARLGRDHSAPPRIAALDSANGIVNEDLFLEPMMGTPLQVYIEKDVSDRDLLVELVTVSRVRHHDRRNVLSWPASPFVVFPLMIVDLLGPETWRRDITGLQRRTIHSWYVRMVEVIGSEPHRSLNSSRSPQGVGTKPLSTVCRQERKGRPQCPMDT
jgi:hypothetical protein